MQQIEIFTSKRKLVIALFSSLILIALGFTIIFGYPKDHLKSSYSVFIGILTIFTFGIFALLAIKKLCSESESLIINKQGIILPKAGLIEWSDIAGFTTVKIQGTKIILINVIEVEKYFSKLNKLSQFWVVKSQQLFGAPFSISPSSLKCKFNYLEQLLQEKLREYRESV